MNFLQKYENKNYENKNYALHRSQVLPEIYGFESENAKLYERIRAMSVWAANRRGEIMGEVRESKTCESNSYTEIRSK